MDRTNCCVFIITNLLYLGTWTTRVVDDESSFVHVRNDISVLSAATLRTNPGTAYRMLKDFVDLQEGD